ncbi:unnamed protein product [Owenia fusiformis]|uniref:Uncharacterized protein n=1 Tax=Owenia fusiformis TaxID=6347 RepID=A0A8S4PXB2_OWEFU|nr:unnamed protein product [Owenia fusiformis]
MAEGGNKQTETELFSEALQELPRNDDLKRMLIEIIDARINPINESLANIDEKMTKFEKIESDIGVMKKQLSEKTKKLTVDIEQNKRNIKQTEEKLLRLDLQRRQTNLIIDNIEQKGGENVIKTVETCLGNIGCAVSISNAYRMGAPGGQGRIAPIFVEFQTRRDVDRVKKTAWTKQNSKTVKIREDLPNELRKLRGKAYANHIKAAKREQKKFRWDLDKLFINNVQIDLSAEIEETRRDITRNS